VDFLNPAENPTGFTIFILVFTGAVIALSMVWRQRWASGLLTGGMADGVPATAVILGMGQTGVTINEQPQLTFALQVQLAGQAPYQADVKQTVPLMTLGMLAPGRTVAVRVSPGNPQKVRLDLQATANLGSVAAVPGMTSQPGAAGAPPANVVSNDELVATGTPVAAVVMALQETGQFHGSDPIVIMNLRVHPDSGAYDMQGAYRVPADKRGRLMPGVTLRGALHPTDRDKVGVDWRAL
jgi:hypothetical protein